MCAAPSTAGFVADPPPLNAGEAQSDSNLPNEPAKSGRSARLAMSRAVVCRSIDGYEQFEPLDPPVLTSDEKLLVYYRPLHYRIVQRKQDYVVHFSQDGAIRRKGRPVVLRSKKRLLDIESTSRESPDLVYLRNAVSLKGLSPGFYEYVVTLRDENAPGSQVKQTVGFRIAPAAAKAEGGGGTAPGASGDAGAPAPDASGRR